MSGSYGENDSNENPLTPMLGEMRAIVKDEISSLKDSLMRPICEGNKSIQEMKSELEIITKNLSATRELTNTLALGTITAFSHKKMLNPVVAAQLHSTDMFLRSDLISAVTISSVSKYVTASYPVLDEDVALEVTRLLLFAPGAHMRKKARKTDLGRKFMEFRIKVIRNMIFNCQQAVQRDCLALLQPFLCLESAEGKRSEPSDSNLGSVGTIEAARLRKAPFRPPAWTGKGFISREDIDMAVGETIKHEVDDSAIAPDGGDSVSDGNTPQSQVAKKRKTSCFRKMTVRKEIAREVVKHMWKRWTDWFGNSRNEARKSFTLDLGVVFLEPNTRWKPMCSCNSVDDYYQRVGNLPNAETSSVFRTNYEATSRNLQLFRDMMKEFPNFFITCQYIVEVFEGVDEMAQKQGGQEMTLRRSVHLLEVAANFLTAYFQVSSLETFLGGSENSFHLIFVVALAFSDIVSRAAKPRVGNKQGDLVCSEAKELGLLIPGDSGRLNFITERCLRMTRDVYQVLNKDEGEKNGTISDGEVGGELCSDDDEVENVFI